MIAVHRGRDGELVGWVSRSLKGFEALTVFAYPLARFEEDWEAEEWLVEHGLGMLAKEWHVFVPEEGRWFVAMLEEAGRDHVTVRIQDSRSERDRSIIRLDGSDLGYLRGPLTIH